MKKIVWAMLCLTACAPEPVNLEELEPDAGEAVESTREALKLAPVWRDLPIEVLKPVDRIADRYKPLPPWFFCGAEGGACCHGPSNAADPVFGPLVRCDDGLGCDVATDTCVAPCGGNGQVCCDGPSTRALKWTSDGRVYSPNGFDMREMCDSGACEKLSHRCVACGTVAGAACCPPDAAQATARCMRDELSCRFDDDWATSGTCLQCGTRGAPPCSDRGCDPGLGILNELCDVCGGFGQVPCDAQPCTTGCNPGLKLSKGVCTSCGGVGQVPCDTLSKKGPGCTLYQSACDSGLRIRGGLCQTCGGVNQAPCDSGCDWPLRNEGGLCKACGRDGQAPCSSGCDAGLELANRLCRRCGAEYQIPCDRGCNAPMKPVGGKCHLCGSEGKPPCDASGCNPGLEVQFGVCRVPDSSGPSCASPGQACVPNKQPGTHCCGQQLCVFGYCKPCLNHGEECAAGGVQLCCDPGDSCVLDQWSETVQCGIPG